MRKTTVVQTKVRDLRKNKIPAKQSIFSSIVQNLIGTLLRRKSLKLNLPQQQFRLWQMPYQKIAYEVLLTHYFRSSLSGLEVSASGLVPGGEVSG